MRVIGGSERGRRLQVPKGRDVRPTPDRVRETLFNWLQGEIDGAAVLDLFAGSGALGVEALSRGAAYATFVENHRAALGALAGNLEWVAGSPRHEAFRSPLHESPPRGGENGPFAEGRGGSGEDGAPGEGGGRSGRAGPDGASRYEIVRASAWRFLERPPARRYDLVFLDPPYGRGWAAQAAGLLAAGGWLAPHAVVYVETGSAEDVPDVPADWELRREGTAGDVAYRLYQTHGEETV